MDTKELRRGNLLLMKTSTSINPDGDIVEVRAILENGVAVSGDGQHLGIECFSPIPLSDSMLVLIGFEKSPDKYENMGYFNSQRYGLGGRIRISYEDIQNENKKYFYLPTFYTCVRIKYVHQLQNLFYAISGEELPTDKVLVEQ